VQAPSVTQRMVRFEIVGRIFSTNQEKEKLVYIFQENLIW